MERNIKNINVYSNNVVSYVVDREKSKEITGYASIDKPWQKYYSKEAIEAEIPKMTLYNYMVSENQDNLDTTAIEYFGTKISFSKFIKKIDETAKAFYNLGVREGDVVTIMSIANPELEIAFYALNKIGAISNFIDVRSDSNIVKGYLDEVNSKVLLVMDNFVPEIDKIIDSTNVENAIIISPFNSLNPVKRLLANIGDNIKNKEKRIKLDIIMDKNIYISWDQFISQYRSNDEVYYPDYKKDTVASYVHTGGTTGVSKTVRLSNENFNAMVLQFRAFNTYIKGDTFLNDIVPFVAYGILGAIHMPLCLGLTNIIAPILSPEEFTQFMIKYKPNNVLAVPTYWEHFKNDKRVNKMDLSFLKHPGSGGDATSAAKEEELNAFFRNHNSNAVIELGYGLTEVGSAAVACVGDINKIGSVGVPLVKNIVGIFDENTGEELKYNEIGEVRMKSPTTMIGYLNNMDEENKIIKIHSDGTKWVHTGDLGKIDKDGFIYLTGRIKRMIIHGGFKLYPSEIEGVILKNCNVESCCVISIPDKQYGSSPEAHVVIKDKKIDLEELRDELIVACKENLPEYSQPCDFVFVDDLPLTTVGKVDYRKVENDRLKKLVRKI